MSTLPFEFFEFKSVWESIPIEEWSVNELTERLRLIEMRLPSKPDSTALVATKKKAAKKVERKCYVCRKPGHIAKDYWKKDRKQKTSSDAFVCIVEGVTEKEQWIADSGTSAHMTSYRKYFLVFKEFPSPKPVYEGNNNAIMAYGQGTVNVDMKVNEKLVSNHLSEVWYVPDVSRNLFSVSQTLAKRFVFRAEGNECSFARDGHVRLRGIRTINGLYALKMSVVCPEVPAEVCVASADQSLQLWHERLCHQNKTYVKEFFGQRGIEVCESKVSCEGCLYGKHQRGRFHERPSRPIVTGALIHADEIGEASCDAIDSKESSDEQERNLRDRSMLKKPARYDNCVLLAEHAEPDTYKEAIASKESSEWLAAMKEEMDSLESNNTWELVNLPQD
ncbi:hypothetical protein AVEN_193379-1 [Araneus ventricosus]|uniref:Uncharacterized protein n=1 Tax=Araneus ventricosus TaxID=182803 RepID=A0A4Y2F8K0_ARAVE|nr:hypothetical protein AVEN_193379-1 [Araneus ventricosus]